MQHLVKLTADVAPFLASLLRIRLLILFLLVEVRQIGLELLHTRCGDRLVWDHLPGQIRQADEMTVIVIFGVDPVSIKGLRTLEDAREAVVFLHAERIGLVIVAACTGDGTAQNGTRHRVELLVGHIGGELHLVLLIQPLRSDGEKAGRNEQPRTLSVVLRRKQVTGDLLGDEAVERHIRIHRIDHIVAIAPRMRKSQIRLAAVRLGKPCHIQPVAAPAFSEAGALKKLINLLFIVGQVGRVRQVGRWQADEIEKEPPQQHHRFCFGRRLQTVLLQLRADEAIDAACTRFRHHGPLVAPKVPPRLDVHWRTFCHLRG